MKSITVCFNMILLGGSLLAFTSCSTTKPKEVEQTDKKEKKEEKPEKYATNLSIHMEVNPDGTDHNGTVPVYRAHPTLVNVQKEPSLDPGYMKKAEIVDADKMGGFAIKITFNERGSFRLQNMTTSNKGHRLAVFCQWKESRWLAAPMISKGITDGILIFTPDATREETERIVIGLNNVIKKLDAAYTF